MKKSEPQVDCPDFKNWMNSYNSHEAASKRRFEKGMFTFGGMDFFPYDGTGPKVPKVIVTMPILDGLANHFGISTQELVNQDNYSTMVTIDFGHGPETLTMREVYDTIDWDNYPPQPNPKETT